MCGSAGASNRFDSFGYSRKIDNGNILNLDSRPYRLVDNGKYQSVMSQSNKYVEPYSNGSAGFDASQVVNANIPISSLPVDQTFGTSTTYYPRIDVDRTQRTSLPSKLRFLENDITEFRDKVSNVLDPFDNKGNCSSSDQERLSRLSKEWARIKPSSDVTDDIIACFAGNDTVEPRGIAHQLPSNIAGNTTQGPDHGASGYLYDPIPTSFTGCNVSNAVQREFQSNFNSNNSSSHNYPVTNQAMNHVFAGQASHLNHTVLNNHDYRDPNMTELQHGHRRQTTNTSVYNNQSSTNLRSHHNVDVSQLQIPSSFGTDASRALESCGQIGNLLQQDKALSNEGMNLNYSSNNVTMQPDHFFAASMQQQAQSCPNQEQKDNFYGQTSQLDLLFGIHQSSSVIQNEDTMSSTLHNYRVTNEDFSGLFKKSSNSDTFDHSVVMNKNSGIDDVSCIGSQELMSAGGMLHPDMAAASENNTRCVRKRPKHEPRVKEFVEPSEHDVLLGRGSRTNIHPGNQRYLVVKDMLKARYIAASNDEKTQISQELVDLVHSWGGKFLKLDEGSESSITASVSRQANNSASTVKIRGNWYEVLNIVARRKASQSLRDINTPEERAAKRRKYGLDKSSKRNQT
jgi:hypothetical protein